MIIVTDEISRRWAYNLLHQTKQKTSRKDLGGSNKREKEETLILFLRIMVIGESFLYLVVILSLS